MCETSKMEAWVLQWMVDSMMVSLYWIGIDQPANGTILPVIFCIVIVGVSVVCVRGTEEDVVGKIE